MIIKVKRGVRKKYMKLGQLSFSNFINEVKQKFSVPEDKVVRVTDDLGIEVDEDVFPELATVEDMCFVIHTDDNFPLDESSMNQADSSNHPEFSTLTPWGWQGPRTHHQPVEREHLSVPVETEQGETQSPVTDAKSLHQNGQKQKRTIFQKGWWITGSVIFIICVCVLAMAFKESGGRPALPDLKILLVGKTGAGKSSTGNTILRRGVFKEGLSPVGLTLKCETHSGVVAGREVTVTDTPGIFDTSLSGNQIKRQMVESSNHFFLIVIRLGRFTEEVRATLKWMQDHFGAEALRYSMVLFTGGDELSTPVEEFLRKSSDLQEVVNRCGGGYHVFNNKEKNNRAQVTELLEKIEAVLLKMTGYHHATMMIQQAQRKIQAEEERKRKKMRFDQIISVLMVAIGIIVPAAVFGKHTIQKIRLEEKKKREEAERNMRNDQTRLRNLEQQIRAEKERNRGLFHAWFR